jgi:hypothetical protein
MMEAIMSLEGGKVLSLLTENIGERRASENTEGIISGKFLVLTFSKADEKDR